MTKFNVDEFMAEFPHMLESEFVLEKMLQHFVLACCLAARESRENAQTIINAIEKSPKAPKILPVLEAMKMHLKQESRAPIMVREAAEDLLTVIEGKENRWKLKNVQSVDDCSPGLDSCPLKIRDENACPKCGGEMGRGTGFIYAQNIDDKNDGDSHHNYEHVCGKFCNACGVFVFEKEGEQA